MKHYRFVINASDILARAGIPQAQVAREAKTTRYHLNRKILDRTAIRATTAWKIARAYAALVSISEDEAFTVLFEEITEENRTPYLVAA